ncbi:hypothetical protein QFZ87_004661 [Bacillus sp. SLBN-46]|nr:hypothetical protein [Bacillus sp. SLBN-46]
MTINLVFIYKITKIDLINNEVINKNGSDYIICILKIVPWKDFLPDHADYGVQQSVITFLTNCELITIAMLFKRKSNIL